MDITSKEKIRDIKSVINEFYHNEKCEGRLTECARKSWLLFQEYCDDILQDLERLEALEKENKEHLKNVKIQIGQKTLLSVENARLNRENEKLKKTIEIFKTFISVSKEVNFDTFITSYCDDDVFDLLKEVLGE